MKSVFILIFVLIPFIARASTTEELEKTRDFLKLNYPSSIESSFRSYVYNYYAWQYEDFTNTIMALASHEKASWSYIKANKEAWDQTLIHAMEGPPGQAETLAMDLGDRMAAIQTEAKRLQVLYDDLKLLNTLWQNRCHTSRMKYTQTAFDPGRLFAASHLNLKAEGAPFAVSILIPPDYNGNLGKPAFFKDEDKVILSMSSAIGGYFGPIGSVVGMVVGSVVVTVKNIFVFNSEMDKQNELIQEIIQIQKNEIGSLAGRKVQIISEVCNNMLPDTTAVENSKDKTKEDKVSTTLTQITAAVSRHLEVAKMYSGEVRSGFSGLEGKIKKDLRKLINVNAEKVVSDFYQNLGDLEQKLTDSDQAVQKWFQSLASTFLIRNQNTSDLERANQDQAIWNSILEAEAKYVVPESYTQQTLWNTSLEIIAEELGK